MLVVQLDLVETRLRDGPGPRVFDEEIPVGLPLREALGERRRLLVDGTNAQAEAERLRLIADTGLVHQLLAADGVAAEADAALDLRTVEVLHDNVGVLGIAGPNAARAGGPGSLLR